MSVTLLQLSLLLSGVVGGWRKEFDEEMALDAEKWMRETLQNNNIEYPS